ncbi:MAG: 2-hydroxyacyl-CoA dehydratase [Bacilli bacterium]|jgi:predicted nucleotide-binding protein (sugar kinase/HSP70/actin superfamily)
MKKISFPHLGNYYIPISFLLKKITNCQIIIPDPITKRTLDLGSKYSPENACVPFKYNLGNYIESLNKGANILIQAGGGCRYGYYAEVQEEILKNLGYDFEFYCLVKNDCNILTNSYKVLKKINPKLSFLKYSYYLVLTMKMINYMDKIDIYIRKNIGFEEKRGSFELILEKMLREFSLVTSFFHLRKIYKKYLKIFKSIKINKPENCLKIGILGELYTSMEPFSSYSIEKILAEMGVEIVRYTNVTYLLITKLFNKRKILKECGSYCKYTIGADGTDNVARALELIKDKFDGLIHTKPFGCMPEIGAMSILQKISNDYKIPIIYFSFDTHTSEEGIKTRLEAFFDMLQKRKERL